MHDNGHGMGCGFGCEIGNEKYQAQKDKERTSKQEGTRNENRKQKKKLRKDTKRRACVHGGNYTETLLYVCRYCVQVVANETEGGEREDYVTRRRSTDGLGRIKLQGVCPYRSYLG